MREEALKDGVKDFRTQIESFRIRSFDEFFCKVVYDFLEFEDSDHFYKTDCEDYEDPKESDIATALLQIEKAIEVLRERVIDFEYILGHEYDD